MLGTFECALSVLAAYGSFWQTRQAGKFNPISMVCMYGMHGKYGKHGKHNNKQKLGFCQAQIIGFC